jgi:hypothetical protein
MHTPTFTVGALFVAVARVFFFDRAGRVGWRKRERAKVTLTNAKLRDLDITPVSSRRPVGHPAVLRDVESEPQFTARDSVGQVLPFLRARFLTRSREEAFQARLAYFFLPLKRPSLSSPS